MTVESIIQQNRAKATTGRYTYPNNQSAHNIVLTFRDYSYQGTEGVVRPRATANMSAAVVLPLPSNLADTYSVNINPFEMGTMGAAVADAISGSGRSAISGDLGRYLGSLGEGGTPVSGDNMISNALSSTRAAGAFIGRNLLDEIPGLGGISGAVDVATGTAINPHMTLRFEGVNLKSHTFTWTLSPESEQEAETLKNLINFIRQKMLPTYGDPSGQSSLSRTILNYPSLVDIYFTGVNQDYFYYFKPCMIQNFTTDYTPNGIVLNRGGKPSFITMTMQLSEARIHTASDVNVAG